MWIYKIENIKNGKQYIGQSIRPIEQRFQRHINDAINCKLNTHFARANRKYVSSLEGTAAYSLTDYEGSEASFITRLAGVGISCSTMEIYAPEDYE